MSTLVVVSGLPGTGKSTLATALASELEMVMLTKDVIEAALWRQGIDPEQNSSWAAHEVLTAVAESALGQGRSVILDTVATTEEVRKDWRTIARLHDARFVVIVCECSDPEIHRGRIEGRHRGIAGWPELEWSDVESVRRRWEQWSDPHLVLDALTDKMLNVSRALEYVRSGRALPTQPS